MILISLVLAICIFANIVYCYKRKVNEKIAGQILEHQVRAEEGGIDEIALDPMDENFGPNVAQNANQKTKEKGNKKQYVKFEDDKEDVPVGDGAQTGAITGAVTAFTMAQ